MNTLKATLKALTATEQLSILCVDVSGDQFNLLLAEQCHDTIGSSLTLAFKETEVILTKTLTSTTANIQHALIQTIERGEVFSQITLNYREALIKALVPTLMFNLLEVDENESIYWMIQPSEISLLRGHDGI